MHLHIDFFLFLIVEVIVLKLGLEFFVVDLIEQILELLVVLVFEGIVDKFARKVVSVRGNERCRHLPFFQSSPVEALQPRVTFHFANSIVPKSLQLLPH